MLYETGAHASSHKQGERRRCLNTPFDALLYAAFVVDERQLGHFGCEAMAAANTAPATEPAGAAAEGSSEDDNEKDMQTALGNSDRASSQARSERLEQRRKLSQIRKDNRTGEMKVEHRHDVDTKQEFS